MDMAFSNSISGLKAATERVHNRALNIANVNTKEYKSRQSVQSETVQGHPKVTVNRDLSAGPLLHTGVSIPPEVKGLEIQNDGDIFALPEKGDPYAIGKLIPKEMGYTRLPTPAGWEEGSNTRLEREIPEIMVDEKDFKANTVVIKTQDAMLGELVNLKA